LLPCDKLAWKDEAAVFRLAEPLRQRGFRPVGFFQINELPRYRMWTLLHRRESIFAIITEHDRSEVKTILWLELLTHFRDGTTLTYTTADIPDHIRTKHPSRIVEYYHGYAAGSLYERLRDKRPQKPLRQVTAKEFPFLFEEGYAQFVTWRELDDDESYYADLIHNNLGSFVLPADKVETGFRKSVAVLTHLAYAFPAQPIYTSKLARWRTGLGLLYATIGKVENAEAAYREALAVAGKQVRKHADRLDDAVTLGRICLNLGNLHRDGRGQAALDWYKKAVRTLERVLTRDPKHAQGKRILRHVCRSRAITLTRLERHAEALADWDRLMELEEISKPGTRWQRARTLARLGECERALREAKSLAGKGRPSSRTLYDLASVYALCARGPENVRSPGPNDAALAVALLRQATGRRYGKRLRELLMTDPDLEALRSREDYRELLRELETRTKRQA
jgi:tetratricopeptide (TPR) repeat protein